MPKFLSWPIGIFLITISLGYRQWNALNSLYSLDDGHRLALILGGILLALMVVLRLVLGNWNRAFIGSLILPIVLHALLQSYLIPAIIVGVGVVMLIVEKRLIADRFLASVNGVALVSITSFTPVVKVLMEPNTLVANSNAPLGQVELKKTPSIIHIVADGYGSSAVLKEMYNLPVDDFNKELRSRGFVVFEKGVVAYNQTLLSMASLYSAGYLVPRAEDESNAIYRRKLANTVDWGGVKTALRDAGYNFFFTESGLSVLDLAGGSAVTKNQIPVTGLETSFLLTAHLPALVDTGPTAYLRGALEPGLMDGLPQPFYFHQHLIAPHPPFDIDRDGNPRFTELFTIADASHATHGKESLQKEYLEGYPEKTRYLWARLLEQFDALPKMPKIVIIHGDHGPGTYVNHSDVTKTCLRERMTTTMAIYTDDPEFRAKLEQISGETFGMANLFRLLFEHMGNKPIPLLPIKSHYANWENLSAVTPLTLEDVHKPCGVEGK